MTPTLNPPALRLDSRLSDPTLQDTMTLCTRECLGFSLFYWFLYMHFCLQAHGCGKQVARFNPFDTPDVRLIQYIHSAHFTGIFFAWHRHFLATVEGLLRTKCNYPGYLPFWDWTLGGPSQINKSLSSRLNAFSVKDYHDVKHSYLFNTDPNVGFGAFPGPETNYTVTTGAFHNLIRGYPLPHHVQRHYTVTVSPRSYQQAFLLASY